MKRLFIIVGILIICSAVFTGSALGLRTRKSSISSSKQSSENDEQQPATNQDPPEIALMNQISNENSPSSEPNQKATNASEAAKEESQDKSDELSQPNDAPMDRLRKKKKEETDRPRENENSDNEKETSERRNSTGSLEFVVERLQAAALESSSRRSSVDSYSGTGIGQRNKFYDLSSREDSTDNPSKAEYSMDADDEEPFSQLKPSVIQSEMLGKEKKASVILPANILSTESESKLQLMREIAALRPSKFTSMASKPGQSGNAAEENYLQEIPQASSIISSSRNPNGASTSPMGSPKSLDDSFSVKMKSSQWEQMAKKANQTPATILPNTPKKKRPDSSISSKIEQFESLSSSEPGTPSVSRSNSEVRKLKIQQQEFSSQQVEQIEEPLEKDEILQTKALSSVSNSPFKQNEIIIQPMPPEMLRKASMGIAKAQTYVYDDFANFTDEE
jgi:hypothetical protein